MRHISIEPPAFFHRGPTPLARLAFFGLISIALLFVDTRFHYLEGIRRVVAVALYPLQRAAQLPGELVSDIGSYFASLQALTEENAALKRQLVERTAAAQGFALAQQENARLRTLTDLSARYAAGATAVEVLYSSRDPFAQRLYVGKGVDAELHPGEAVIDADGVVGQVTRVFPNMAEVTLVTDKDHAVPVKVQRSGVRSVLYGSGAGRPPELRFMAPAADIQVGTSSWPTRPTLRTRPLPTAPCSAWCATSLRSGPSPTNATITLGRIASMSLVSGDWYSKVDTTR